LSQVAQFFEAVERGNAEQVRHLLSSNAALLRARNGEGATALHVAAFHGHRAIVSLLCAIGAELNARDDRFGATPSGWAIHYLRELGGLLAIEIEDALYAIQTRDAAWALRLITRHPALVTARDAQGKPLAEHARESGDPAIASLFEAEQRELRESRSLADR
jgi:hypothetical protein